MADNTVRTYDPKEVLISFGTVSITGLAEGTFINIERSGDVFTTVKGADGGVDRVNNNNTIFTIEITLKQTSTSNETLSAALMADLALNAGVLPLSIKDLRSSRAFDDTSLLGENIVFFAAQAWIQKDPDSEYADILSNRTWTFSCTGVKIDSGNAGQPAA